MNLIILFLGKIISSISKSINLGHGSTWPGHIALKINPEFIADLLSKSKTKIVLITGTNGKTTTAKLIKTILEKTGKKVFVNSSGANLLNGVASSIIVNSSFSGKLNWDYALFEVDENTLPQITEKVEPDYIIALNLFRDQLDRYGEIDTIAKKWKESYKKLLKTKLILNGDDPQVAFLGDGIKSKSYYFGINDKNLEHKNHQHASDSILCPKCGNKLKFEYYYFSHLGKWQCEDCKFKRPQLAIDKFDFYPLRGTYMIYDTLAAVLFSKLISLKEDNIKKALNEFTPAFGRQEIIKMDSKKIQFFLSKNPTSFNESLKTIDQNGARNLLIVLNDRIPDGTDVSWIWDIDFDNYLSEDLNLTVSGDRAFDLALRLKYSEFKISNSKFRIEENLKKAIDYSLEKTDKNNTLYILPTYSAMLETRKVLTGRKIL